MRRHKHCKNMPDWQTYISFWHDPYRICSRDWVVGSNDAATMELCQSVSSVVNVNHQFVKMMGMGAVLCELIGPGCGDGENNISLTI